ncbi:universal stress protein [Membranihabitans maritimus]|uniref:universal stress protein n=1 Tax=Membranihabitans maritimus TaxID=2904244 RepID=UPI001F15A6CC|nr:universal stress protein [Membranihabitans maritimus]
MKTILLPTNFSEKSRNSIKYAIDMFGDEDVKFVLLNAYSLPNRPTELMVSALRDEGDSERIEELENEFSQCLGNKSEENYTVEIHCRFGRLSNVVLDYCRENSVDYIIMGLKETNRINAIFNWVFNKKEWAQIVNCPVIYVPKNVKYKKPTRVILPVEMRNKFQKKEINPLVYIARKYKFHVTMITDFNERNLKSENIDHFYELKDAFMDIEHSIAFHEGNNFTKGMEWYMLENNADLIVTVGGKMPVVSQFFQKNNVHNMVLNSSVPLLAINHFL